MFLSECRLDMLAYIWFYEGHGMEIKEISSLKRAMSYPRIHHFQERIERTVYTKELKFDRIIGASISTLLRILT